MTPRPMYMQIPVEEYEKLNKRIAELEKENESLKYSVATLDTDLAMMKRWRKVSEELPRGMYPVLIYVKNSNGRGYITTGHYNSSKNIWYEHVDYGEVKVTHFMDFPEPPEVK